MIEKKYELLQVKNDVLFHDLINEHEMDTIEWIVMQILECNYEDIHGKVEVKNIRLTRINRKERSKYVDLIVSYKNEKIILELNNNFNSIYVRNFLFGANQLMNNYQLKRGNYYMEITRVIVVNLNWYSGNKGNRIKGKKIYEIPYSDLESDGYLYKMINVNLDYYSSLCYDKVDVKDKLYKLLIVKNKKELNYLIKHEKLLNKYGNKLIDLSSDNNYVEEIMSEEIEEFVAMHEAYRSGLLEKERETIINMHNNDCSLELISKCINLPIEQIKEIINENNN